jgi:hypothetical protein
MSVCQWLAARLQKLIRQRIRHTSLQSQATSASLIKPTPAWPRGLTMKSTRSMPMTSGANSLSRKLKALAVLAEEIPEFPQLLKAETKRAGS